ncbi:MAG: NUDIX domain-containing protein [Candidatus Moranbacteria bacterium]|nr:NUDIX domain-containing protein [Candidatus Moranbacteria bacterium]
MANYNKIGLLVLNNDQTRFLVVQKYPQNVTADFIMPGGQFEEETIEECLKNEIKEELNCEVDFDSLGFISEYEDEAAGRPEKTVSIKLYQGKLIGIPAPSTEIEHIHWITKDDISNPQVSPIIRNKIIPDLVKKNILK